MTVVKFLFMFSKSQPTGCLLPSRLKQTQLTFEALLQCNMTLYNHPLDKRKYVRAPTLSPYLVSRQCPGYAVRSTIVSRQIYYAYITFETLMGNMSYPRRFIKHLLTVLKLLFMFFESACQQVYLWFLCIHVSHRTPVERHF